MPIQGIEQPEIIQIDSELRLRKFDGIYDFAFDWYQDVETVYMVDGVKNPYSRETLKCMYEYLDKQGELYFIEVKAGNNFLPIGDVTFWKDDMPIVIGDKSYRGKGIAKRVIGRLIERGKELGYECLRVNEIYDFNAVSRKCFEGLGFRVYEQTEKGNRFIFTYMKWIFFDLGSTLIDESDCAEYRLQQLLGQPNAPSRELLEKRMKEYASLNRLPYKDAAKEFGLETIKWPTHLEKLYDETLDVLEQLRGKYKLGIIANQNYGTEERMIAYGIRKYFDVIISSAEAGVSKPDLNIFKLGLEKAGCLSEEAYMIGDRLDNDIEPAGQIGMRTIWVRQGSFADGNVELIEHKPDIIVSEIKDILKYL